MGLRRGLADDRTVGALSSVGGTRADVRIGVSGWRYPPWRGTFYPKGLAQSKELPFASRAMRSIEINGSFYSLQRPSSYARWYGDTPDDFVFALKGGRFMTHNKKLRECGVPLANFFASGVLALHDKLGPVLWQLPPQLAFDRQRLEDFFGILPRTTAEASRLAEKHDQRLKSPGFFSIREDRPIRYAIEVRHESYRDTAFVRLLRKHDVALCIADTAGRWPYFEDVTSDFVYVRLHGAKELYVSGYSSAALDRWGKRIEAWRDGDAAPLPATVVAEPVRRRRRDVFVYFDNDVKVRAPYDAMNLAARLGHGHRVSFPSKAHRRSEAERGVELPRTNWDRWRGRAG
jgi:uncharacterized protein YecE (DUF72 family)